MQGNRYTLIGIYENYAVNGLGNSFQTSPGIHYGLAKSNLVEAITEKKQPGVHILHDPPYLQPTAGSFSVYSPGMCWAYMYQQQLQGICYQNRGQHIIELHSLIDIYAEYIMVTGRRLPTIDKFVDREMGEYHKCYCVHPSDELSEQQKKYNGIVRRLIHDHSIHCETVFDYRTIPGLIWSDINYAIL